jgi:hypothetical protein
MYITSHAKRLVEGSYEAQNPPYHAAHDVGHMLQAIWSLVVLVVSSFGSNCYFGIKTSVVFS